MEAMFHPFIFAAGCKLSTPSPRPPLLLPHRLLSAPVSLHPSPAEAAAETPPLRRLSLLSGLVVAFFWTGFFLRSLDGIFRSASSQQPPHPPHPGRLESLARQPPSLLISWRGAVRLDGSINHTSVECQKHGSEAESLQRDHRCSSEPWLPLRAPPSLGPFFKAWWLMERPPSDGCCQA